MAVDEMAFVDFLILCDGVEHRWNLRKEAMEKGAGFWPK